MNKTLKVLDQKGVEYLWSKISMQDYPNNETLISVIEAIDETKADKSEIKQSDWNQNDSAEMDYIKNKPFYYTPTDTYTIETPEINTYYLLWDFGASEDEFLSSIYKNELSYANITKIPGRPLDNPLYEGAIQYSIAYIGFQSNDGFNGGRYMCDAVSQFASISSKIDDVNYYIFYPSIKYYFILDTTALNTEYQEIFTQCGIYVITNNNMPYTILNATFEIGSSTTLAQRFIPSSIARLNDIPTLDNTLLISGAAADAAAVGEAIAAPKYVAQDTAPEDTNLLWIDTSDEVGACIKYYNTTTQTWENTSASTSPSINMDEILDKMYPVGAIYLSVNDTSPASIYGGTWEQIEDVFLLGAGSAYAAGTTGGEATHTLTIPEMPMHNHIVDAHSHAIGLDNDTTRGTYGWSLHMNANGTTVSGAQLTLVSGTASPGTNARGGGLAHNNMPPYLVVYMWKRIE